MCKLQSLVAKDSFYKLITHIEITKARTDLLPGFFLFANYIKNCIVNNHDKLLIIVAI